MSEHFEHGDIIWAKMKGYPPWPGKIADCDENEAAKKPKKGKHQLIYFFGSSDYAWIEEDQISHYASAKEKFTENLNLRFTGLKDALKQAAEEVERNPPRVKAPPQPVQENTIDSATDSLNDEKAATGKSPATSSSTTATPTTKAGGGSEKKSARSSKGAGGSGSLKRPLASGSDDKHLQKSVKHFLSKDGLGGKVYQSKGGLFNSPRSFITASKPDKSNVIATPAKIGFIGLGVIGKNLVTNMLKTGHEVRIWNRTSYKINDLTPLGAMKCDSPSELMAESDIVFNCLNDSKAAQEVLFGFGGCANDGILNSMKPRKNYVEMTPIQPHVSEQFSKAIHQMGGGYLEAQLFGTVEMAQAGLLTVLCAGDTTLYSDCNTCFQAVGQEAIFVGDVGNAIKLKLALSTFGATLTTGLAECLVLTEKSTGVDPATVLRILQKSPFNAPGIISQAEAMIKGDHHLIHASVNNQQNDTNLALQVADEIPLPLSVASSVNEVLKRARAQDHGDSDTSSVYWAAMNI